MAVSHKCSRASLACALAVNRNTEQVSIDGLRPLPGVESPREIDDLTEPRAAEDACGDGTAITALAMNHQKFLAIQLPGPRGQLP